MATNVYDSRREVYVTPLANTPLKYGFLTNVKAAIGTACGHTVVNREEPPAGLAFGVNSPKPGRASKRTATGTDSTFYSIGNAAALRTAGYSLSRPISRASYGGRASVAVYVTIDGLKYAWRMPEHTFLQVADDITALGIKEVTAGESGLVWGAQFPKPPRARKIEADNVISTFCDPSKLDSLPTGWSAIIRDGMGV